MKPSPLFADIVIADTDTEAIRSTRMLLQSAGYTTWAVTNIEDLLSAMHSHPVDLVLMSPFLAQGNGLDIIRKLKSETQHPFIPVILMLPNEKADIAGAMNAGADEVITKPIDRAQLLLRVRGMLKLKGTTDELKELNATLEQKVVERTHDLEQAYIHLRHAEKLSSLGRLAASVAHEINNPLTSILTLLYLIKSNIGNDPALKDDFRVIEQQIKVIAKLVAQLRDFSRPPSHQRRLTDLNHAIEEILHLGKKQLETKNVQLTLDLAHTLAPVMVAPEQMGQVFLNLLINAQDAMPDGGILTIRTFGDARSVYVQFCDTGTGMPSEVVERIFEPFFTTKGDRGTGLGLAISHRIIDDFGGSFHVQSQIGKGTTFVIKLPVAEPATTTLNFQEIKPDSAAYALEN